MSMQLIFLGSIAASRQTGETVADVPSVFTDWDASAGELEISITITNLPDDNGSSITFIEYSFDGDDWLEAPGLGSFVITDVESGTYDIYLRAVNAIGPGPSGDSKQVIIADYEEGPIEHMRIAGYGVDELGPGFWRTTGPARNPRTIGLGD